MCATECLWFSLHNEKEGLKAGMGKVGLWVMMMCVLSKRYNIIEAQSKIPFFFAILTKWLENATKQTVCECENWL